MKDVENGIRKLNKHVRRKYECYFNLNYFMKLYIECLLEEEAQKEELVTEEDAQKEEVQDEDEVANQSVEAKDD